MCVNDIVSALPQSQILMRMNISIYKWWTTNEATIKKESSNEVKAVVIESLSNYIVNS